MSRTRPITHDELARKERPFWVQENARFQKWCKETLHPTAGYFSVTFDNLCFTMEGYNMDDVVKQLKDRYGIDTFILTKSSGETWEHAIPHWESYRSARLAYEKARNQ
jgi:hypothetical protein